ncbi:MAG: C10 family peptidase [Bacteroidetes bacterium]|nr:C10 family peptidase [Bacteroidota bacterium]MCL1969272.1 C10 family peptidase [Bacteroidota bacterium]
MKNISILLIINFLLFLNIFAINEEQAILVTRNFLKERNIGEDSKLSKISIQEVVTKEDMVVFYIMALGDKDGFVIISASEYEPPIVGYSFDSEFQWQPAVQYYIDSYSDYILLEEHSKSNIDDSVTKQWRYYLQETFTPKSVVMNEVLPLITSRWNQDKYYNTYCPWDRRARAEYDYRVPNGCVALATAQLMNYYRHPETGRLGVSYQPPNNYPTQTVLFSRHTYHWDAMCDKATNYTNEIAKLAYHIGVAVRMQYAPGGSGSYTQDAATALHDHFFYTDFEPWPGTTTFVIKKEIDSLQPILMSGSSDGGGHAFLLDGYMETIIDDVPTLLFHFNWGWGGQADGYFTLRNQPFAANSNVYIGLRPATNYPVQCSQLKRQTAFEGYITNGSTNKPYQSNPDCSWIIAAPGAKRYNFSFSRLDTKEGVDVVTIYNGGTKSSGIATTFSGTSIPESVTIIADSVLITFTTTDPTSENTSHLGFLINYVADKPQQKCNMMNNLSEATGYITDGTRQGENYTPWVSCTWNLNIDYSSGFFGLFHEFDLKLGDFIDIYDATKSIPYFWKRFDRYTPPTIGEVISIPFSKIQIKFITDNFEEGNGFKFQYFSILGVNDNSLLDNLTIFPNPASDFIFLSFSSELTNQNIACRIIDLAGKEVYSKNIDYTCDIYATQIPVAHLAKGFYLLQLSTTTGKTTSKIIIN